MATEADKGIALKATQKLSRMGSQYTKIVLTVKNLEITMTGIITNEMHRRPLVKSMNAVPGVRSLVDQIKVVDPKAKAKH